MIENDVIRRVARPSDFLQNDLALALDLVLLKGGMGENIGDNSGIAIAYKAYHIALNGKDAPLLDGYTGDQRFFLSYGQIWREKQRDGAMRAQVLSNPHSPAQFRADGTTRNQDAWYTAFDVKPGQALYLAPADRARVY